MSTAAPKQKLEPSPRQQDTFLRDCEGVALMMDRGVWDSDEARRVLKARHEWLPVGSLPDGWTPPPLLEQPAEEDDHQEDES